MGNFESDLPAVLLVRGSVQRRHATAGNYRINAVVVERVSGFKLTHVSFERVRLILSCPFVRNLSGISKEFQWSFGAHRPHKGHFDGFRAV
jgi:hypothetical protein